MLISGIAVVSSIAIPEPVSLSSFQFQVSHNTTLYFLPAIAAKVVFLVMDIVMYYYVSLLLLNVQKVRTTFIELFV